MQVLVNIALPSADEMLEQGVETAPGPQISQEPLQGAAYRLASAEDMLTEDVQTAPSPQISQEPLQGAAYRLR